MATLGTDLIDVTLPSNTLSGSGYFDVVKGPENSGSTVVGTLSSDSLSDGSKGGGYFYKDPFLGTTEFVYQGGSTVVGTSSSDSLSDGSIGSSSSGSTGEGYWAGRSTARLSRTSRP